MKSSDHPAKRAFKRLKQSKPAMISLCVVMFFALMSLGMEIYGAVCEHTSATALYEQIDVEKILAPPDANHWLGTDYLGRDVLWRAAAGTATAMKVGLIAGTIAVAIGLFAGLAAGYFGGRTDEIITWIYSTFASMPTLLFILAFALLVSKNFVSPALAGVLAFFGKVLRAEPGMLAIYLAIGLTGWVTLCRVVRGECLKLKNAAFVEAAVVAGERSLKIICKHLIPNVFHLVIIYFTLTFASAVMSEVIVSYLGIGVQSSPSWGVMISNGQDKLWQGVWWEITAAGVFMFVLVLALNLLGDALRDALDPQGK